MTGPGGMGGRPGGDPGGRFGPFVPDSAESEALASTPPSLTSLRECPTRASREAAAGCPAFRRAPAR